MELEIEMETKEGEFLVFRTKTWRKVRVVDGDRVLTTILHDENSIIYDTPDNEQTTDFFQKVIRKFGYTALFWMVIEELNELIKEMCKLRMRETTYEKIVEAFMDASIMLNLLRLMLGISDEDYLHVASKRLKELHKYTLRADQDV